MQTVLLLYFAFLRIFRFFSLSSSDTITTLMLSHLASFFPFSEVVPAFFSYMLIVIGQKILRPTVAGMYNYIQPIVACIVAIYWGIESFNFTKVVAVILVFGGVYLVTISKKRSDIEKATNQ